MWYSSMMAWPPARLLRRNIEKLRAMGVTDVWRRDATRLGPNRGAGHDLIFLDPPYGKGLGELALDSALAGGWLAPGARVVWEESAPPVLPPGFDLLDQRKYGDTLVTMARAPDRV
jgi:16S rRNA (guanine966-N2)-methyltransferase